jgi:hypothetical protein
MPFDVSWSAPEGNGLVSRSAPARVFSANREVGDSKAHANRVVKRHAVKKTTARKTTARVSAFKNI